MNFEQCLEEFSGGFSRNLLRRPGLAVALARAAGEGSGLPVTVKLRSGLKPGDCSGVDLAVRLVEEAQVSGIALHPRSAAVQHKGDPDYGLVRQLVDRLEGSGAPVIVSGGLATAEVARRAYRESAAHAVMIARGALGNPWIFEELTGRRAAPPTDDEIVRELLWTLDRAERHLGPRRAAHYARKFYPWYLERLGVTGSEADAFQRTEDLDQARSLLREVVEAPALAA